MITERVSQRGQVQIRWVHTMTVMLSSLWWKASTAGSTGAGLFGAAPFSAGVTQACEARIGDIEQLATAH